MAHSYLQNESVSSKLEDQFTGSIDKWQGDGIHSAKKYITD
jgi:hypothetical protein